MYVQIHTSFCKFREAKNYTNVPKIKTMIKGETILIHANPRLTGSLSQVNVVNTHVHTSRHKLVNYCTLGPYNLT